jgi:hypothetical protein
MTTRTDIRRVINRYRHTERPDLPPWLVHPEGEHQFNLSFALLAAQRDLGIEPIYRRDGRLVAWQGIGQP